MDISDACSANFVELSTDATLSDVRGEFGQDVETRVVVLTDESDEFAGVISRTQLLGSKHSPDERAKSVMRHPPRVSLTEDVRETARLMVESGLDLLPVYEGDQFYGVVTARNLLSLVVPHLDALDVEDAYSTDQMTATSETTLGEVIHQIQEYGISHLPIVDGDDPRGMVSVSDLVDFTVRSMDREQGGSLDGFDAHGGDGSADDYRAHGGHGERAGFADRLLDLPVRNVMSTPLHTVSLGTGLDDAVETMFEDEIHSLVVEDDDGRPTGILTTTDVLRSLTWTEETHMPIQIFGVGNMGVLERSECAERLEEVQSKYAEMNVIEVTVVFQEHDENYRGLPLVRTTVRLFTDRGIYSGTNEGYGAEASFDEACEILERNVLEDKRRDQTETNAELKRAQSAELVEWWAES